MSRKRIVIDVDEKGNCSIEGQGFVGPECEKHIKEVEQALGSTTSSKLKPEHQRRAATGRDRDLQRGQ